MREGADVMTKGLAGPAQHFSIFWAMISLGILSNAPRQSHRQGLLFCHQD